MFKRVFRRAGRNKSRAKERIQIKLAQELSKARKAGEEELTKFFAEIGERYPEYAGEPNTPVLAPAAAADTKVYPPPAPSTIPLSNSPPLSEFNRLVPLSPASASTSPAKLLPSVPSKTLLPLPSVSASSLISKASPLLPTVVRTTLSQGDCLYSSIYRASVERGLLPLFAKCFGIATDTEVKFIQGIRNVLADYVLKEGLLKGKDRFGTTVDTYDQLKELVEGTEFSAKEGQAIAKGAMYAVAAQSFPPWFVSEFGRRGEKLGKKEDFIKNYAAGLRKMENWTGELEINLLKHLLETKKCQIKVDATRTRPSELYSMVDGMEVITVYNPSMGHFEYFSFELDNKKAAGKEAYPVKIPVKKVGLSSASAKALDCKAVAEACQKNLLSPGIMKELQAEIAFLKSSGIVKGGGLTRRKGRKGRKTRRGRSSL